MLPEQGVKPPEPSGPSRLHSTEASGSTVSWKEAWERLVSGGKSATMAGAAGLGPAWTMTSKVIGTLVSPAASVAAHVTVVTPRGKVDPAGGLHATAGLGSAASSATGSWYGTTAPVATAALRSRPVRRKGRRGRVAHGDRERARGRVPGSVGGRAGNGGGSEREGRRGGGGAVEHGEGSRLSSAARMTTAPEGAVASTTRSPGSDGAVTSVVHSNVAGGLSPDASTARTWKVWLRSPVSCRRPETYRVPNRPRRVQPADEAEQYR